MPQTPVVTIPIPGLVRVKDGALARVGLYLSRAEFSKPVVFISEGLVSSIREPFLDGLAAQGISTIHIAEVSDNSFEQAIQHFVELPKTVQAVVGVGGGKALDVAKYIAFLAKQPYFAVPTSLSNDGFCSPQSSLMLAGKRRSLPASLPYAVIVDTAVCRAAPVQLTLSGIGDLLAKFTAITDWKLAFHQVGEPVNDFAALLSDGSIHAFLNHSQIDLTGVRLLATALMLNGIAMQVAGSSRPASGSEHLISHALDQCSARPRLHGLQVGVAAYLVSLLQKKNSDRIAAAFSATGFWQAIAQDPFSRSEWLEAIQLAPSVKPGYHTILSERDVLEEATLLIDSDPYLRDCFTH